jgi:hypothetical protein
MRGFRAAILAALLFLPTLSVPQVRTSATVSVRVTLVIQESETMTVVPADPSQPPSLYNPWIATVSYNLLNPPTSVSVEH